MLFPLVPFFPYSLFSAQEKAHIVAVRSINIFNQDLQSGGFK